MNFRSFFPFLEWLPQYNWTFFKGDFIAGITVAVMLVPQGMAYGLLAGLPPIYGLYAGIIPLFLYAFFGTSRQLSVGPVALVSLLVMSGLQNFAEPQSDLFISLAIATALIAGVIQLILGLFRIGFLINFLSHPVISGFTSAAAIIIGLSQISNLLGLNLQRTNKIHLLLNQVYLNMDQVHWITFFLGIGGIITMLVLKKINKAIPAALVVVILSIILTTKFGWEKAGVEVVGVVPEGLPKFSLPTINFALIEDLLPLALTICLISFIESLAIARTIESQHKSYRISPNQELIALGITKIGGAFFQSFPTTGSFTRSAINNEAGAKTGISSIIAAIVICFTLLFMTPLFYHLPKAILASIILMAVRNLINFSEAKKLWKNDRKDFITMMMTFLATLIFGVQIGVLAGVVLSLALMVYHNSKPHIALLGRLPNTIHYRNISRFNNAEQQEDLAIIRFDAQLYFGNAEYFRETLEKIVFDNPSTKAIILDASSIHDIDSSGIHIFKDVLEYFKNRNIEFYLAEAIGPVRDILYKNHLTELIGKKNQFMYVHDAVEYYQSGKDNWTSHAIQTNIDTDPK